MIDEPEDKVRKALETVYTYFLDRNKPMCFNPYDELCVTINNERDFEDICNSMEDSGVRNVKDCSVFEFYSKVQFLEKKVQKLKNHARQQV